MTGQVPRIRGLNVDAAKDRGASVVNGWLKTLLCIDDGGGTSHETHIPHISKSQHLVYCVCWKICLERLPRKVR